jgi:RHS repeat-associated protein
MSSRTLLTIASLFIVASLLGIRVEAQTFCLTPTAVPQPPLPPSPPPICQPTECDKCTKSPCYVATGIYARDAVDLTIPTAGTFSLDASRLYDSSRIVDGPLGMGWSSSLMPRLYYATYLVTAPSTYSHEADVEMPNGVLYRFTVDGSGAFSPPVGQYDKLVRNGDLTYSLALQHTRSIYSFAADGSLTSLTDDFGNVIAWTYDSAGRVQRVADSAGSGRYIDLTWGADGRVSTLTDNGGRQVKYYYDTSDGTLTGVADPTVSGNGSLRSTNYAYVAARFGKVLSGISDRWGRVISDLDWYSDGKLKSYTDGAYDSGSTSAGEKYTYEYHSTAFPPNTTKTSSLGALSYYYDSTTGLVDPQSYLNGQPTSIANPAGGQAQFSYDALGRVTTVTTPSPEPQSSGSGTVAWWYTYDTSWPEQVASIIPKDLSGNLRTNWAGWAYDYNAATVAGPGALYHVWRVRSDTATKDLVATYAYTSHGRVANVTDVNGVVTAYGYNAAGDLTSITTSGAPSVTQFTYDAMGRPLSRTDPNGHTTTTTYDASDRVLTVTLPKPSPISTYDTVVTYSYDNYDSASGLVFVNTTDANGHTTRVGYDALAQAVQTVDAIGNLTQFTYVHNLLQKVRDANGNETSYGYSAARELTNVTYPDGSTESYNTSGGALFAHTDRLGKTIRYAYDGLGRVSSALYDGLFNNYGAQLGQFYRYDGQKLVEVDDNQPGSSVTVHNYTYDSSWRLVTDAIAAGEKKIYTYGGTGFLLSSYTIQPASGTTGSTQSVAYAYSPSGQVSGESWSWVPGQFTFEYTPSGLFSRMTFPNGQQRHYAYDNQDRVTNVSNTSPGGGIIASFDYAYDYDWQAGGYSMRRQRTSVSVSAPSASNIVTGLTKYSYDADYELVRADYPNNSFDAWTYDGIGNRLSRRVAAAGYTLPYSYYTNAAGGNTQRLRNDSSFDFSYDAAGNVISASSPYVSNAYTWDYAGRLASYAGKTYTYDALGRTSVVANGSTTRYISMNGSTVSERNTTSGVATDYVFGPGIDEPLAKRSADGTISYFGVDGFGSIVVTTDITGSVLNSAGYSPWGETATAPIELFGYTGRETGGPSWYYRARYYDAAHGRFLSEDPIGLPLDINLYRYVLNNPLAYVDPFGEQAQAVAVIGTGVVVTGVVALTVYGYMRTHPEMYDMFRPPRPMPLPIPLPPPAAATGPRDRPVQPGRDEPRPGERYQYPPDSCPLPTTGGPRAPSPKGPCDFPNGMMWQWAAAAPTATERALRAIMVAYLCFKDRSP